MAAAAICFVIIVILGFLLVRADSGIGFVLIPMIVIMIALGSLGLLIDIANSLQEANTKMVKTTGTVKTYQVQSDEDDNYNIKMTGSNLSIPIKNETGTDTWFIPSVDVEIKDSSGQPILMEYNSDGITRYELYVDKMKLYLDK